MTTGRTIQQINAACTVLAPIEQISCDDKGTQFNGSWVLINGKSRTNIAFIRLYVTTNNRTIQGNIRKPSIRESYPDIIIQLEFFFTLTLN